MTAHFLPRSMGVGCGRFWLVQSTRKRERRSLGPVRDVRLREDVVHVTVDCGGTDDQRLSYFGIPPARRDQAEDLNFARREAPNIVLIRACLMRFLSSKNCLIAAWWNR